MLKQKLLIGVSLSAVVALTGCVSERSYVGTDKPVSERTFDNIEAARTRISLGLNYLRRGDTSQAKYNLERARSFAPNSAEVHSALAYYYQSVGENKQAEEYFRTAISKDANYADAYNNYGAFLCQLARYDEAEQLLLKAISRPGYIRVAESYENLALCQLQQNKFSQAMSYLDNSISHNTTRISSLTTAAGVAYAMGNNRLAKNHLDRIQRLGRVSSRTVLLSYLIAEKNGDKDTMRNAEQLLLTLYTDSAETRLLLQNRPQDSEFEQLRERYKDSLMANIVVPDDAQKQVLPTQPVANPKLKVVRRKTAETDSEPAAKTVIENPAATTPNKTSAIASVLQTPPDTAVAKPAPAVSKVPVTVADNQTKAAVEASATTTVESSVSQSAVTSAATKPEPLPPALPVVSSAELLQQQAEADNARVVQQPAVAQSDAIDKAAAPARELPVEELPVEEVATADNAAKAPAATVENGDVAAEMVAETDPVEAENAANEFAADDTKIAVTEPTASDIALTAEVLSEPAVAQAPAPEMTTDTIAEPAFHIVQAAESLYAISVQHNIRLQRLMQWNQLTPESVIKTGQKIWLGPVSDEVRLAPVSDVAEREQVEIAQPFHQVASGETMFGISYRYNIRLDKFLSWNKLTENSKLKVGQRVYIVDPDSVTNAENTAQ